MKTQIETDIKLLLAVYVSLPEDEISLSADLDLEYDMDSTELTEFAKILEKDFAISIAKSQRQCWVTGQDICNFVHEQVLARQAVRQPRVLEPAPLAALH